MFTVTKTAKTIKVDSQKLRKMCEDHNLSLKYIAYETNMYGQSVIILTFNKQYTLEETAIMWGKLSSHYDVYNVSIKDCTKVLTGEKLTLMTITLDGVLDDDTINDYDD